jgi:hypothetical protein
MIMVSGWMEEEEDHRRAFGILPSHISDDERLIRYYELHAPYRLTKVEMELMEFGDDRYDDLSNQVILGTSVCFGFQLFFRLTVFFLFLALNRLLLLYS